MECFLRVSGTASREENLETVSSVSPIYVSMNKHQNSTQAGSSGLEESFVALPLETVDLSPRGRSYIT